MKTKYFILGVVLLLLSCGNGKRGESEVICGGPGIGIDTATVNEIKHYEDSIRIKESTNESPATITPSTSSSSRYDDDEPEYDNMRGFDPASEDDMDDNGMSRYMENNDEEGWD